MRDQGIPSMGKRSNHISQRSSTIYGGREERNITSEELEKEITLRIKAHRARIAEETKHLCDRNIFGDSLKVCVLCTRETCDLHQVKSEKWQRIEDKWYCGKCLKERNEPVLEKSQIDLIKKHLQDANLGYNTGDLTKNYVKDCSALLKELEELLKLLPTEWGCGHEGCGNPSTFSMVGKDGKTLYYCNLHMQEGFNLVIAKEVSDGN